MYNKTYHVYVLASVTYRLYVGITNSLNRRVYEHKYKLLEEFTSRYNVHRLVYFETFGNVFEAIAREKEIKCRRREKKIRLIEQDNPQ